MKRNCTYFLVFTVLVATPAVAARPSLVIINDDFSVAAKSPVPSADFPRLSGDGKIELQTEWGVKADDPDEERSNTSLNTEISPELKLSESLSIEGTVLLEAVRDFDPGENTFFEEEAVFIDELLLKYENGPWEIVAGKFSPDYKGSRDQERGIWTEDFSKEYEIIQKLGLGGSYTFENPAAGTHTISANAFFDDQSFMSRTLGTGKQDICDGENNLSTAILLGGQNPAGVKSLYYEVGYRHLNGCNAGDPDESGLLATIGNVFDFPLTETVTTDLLTEFSYVQDFEGTNDDRQYYSVSSVTTIDKKWNLSLGYTARLVAVSGGNDLYDHLFQASGGYKFDNGLKFDAGWLNTEEAGMGTNILGTLVRYDFDFP